MSSKKKIFRMKNLIKEVENMDEYKVPHEYIIKEQYKIELANSFYKLDKYIDTKYNSDTDSSLPDIPDISKDDLELITKHNLIKRTRSKTV